MKHFLLVSTLILLCNSVWAGPLIEVHKSPSCGCCGKWIEHLKANGFDVTSKNSQNMQQVKLAAGVAQHHASCHTAHVGNYFIEGHVPAADIHRLLEEKPQAKGLTVPGMPVGSPGMEMGERQDPYQVLLVKEDDTTQVFSEYPQAE